MRTTTMVVLSFFCAGILAFIWWLHDEDSYLKFGWILLILMQLMYISLWLAFCPWRRRNDS